MICDIVISNIRQINLNLLVVFDALMREHNLSRAAVQLHMSQPAVSNALARLREQLGEPLFTRTSRGLVPTPQAQKLHETVRQALHLLQIGLGPQQHFDLTSAHVFKLAMNDYGQAHLLPALMAGIRQAAPWVTVSVHDVPAEQLPQALATGAVDMALDYLYFDDADLRYQALLEQEVAVIGRAGHPAFKGQLTLDSYQRSEHVSIQPRAGRGSPLEIVLGSAKIRRQVRLYVPNYLTIPAIVSQSDLLGVVPSLLAQQAAAIHGLEVAPLPVQAPCIQVSLIWHKHQDASPALRWLRNEISALVATAGPAGAGKKKGPSD